jgi:hypothetical protein
MKHIKQMPGGGHLRRMMEQGGAMGAQGQPSLEQQAQMITNQILEQVGPGPNQRADFFMSNAEGDFQRLRPTPSFRYEDFEREVQGGQDQMNAALYEAVLRALNNPNSEDAFQLKRMLDMRNIQMGRGGVMEYRYGGKVYADKGAMLEGILQDPEQRAAAQRILSK